MVIVISVTIVFLTILVGIMLAYGFSRLDRVVGDNQVTVDQQGRLYNPALTLGFEINPQANSEDQVQEARKLAAKKAAALPRGANVGIGRLGQANLRSAGQGAKDREDPWTAAKIARFHGWDGVKTGFVIGAPAPASAPAAGTPAAAPASGGEIELVPGKDYPVIEITDGMSPDEVRKARIANSKAKSAALKAAKAAGAPAAASTATAATPTATAATTAAPPIPNIEPPQMTPITDDMPDDEKRKARIANSKAKSAFNKALKAAGIDPKTVEVTDSGEVIWPGGAPPAPTQAAAAPPPAAAPAPAPSAPTQASGDDQAAAAGIPKPDLIEITDGMSPDEIRQARIANSKAKSAYNKALKAAGIDPSTVS